MSKNKTYMAFLKMHGLGNDFVIFDSRTKNAAFQMTAARASFVADRHRGVGCDQLVVLRQSKRADVYMEIWNADGSRVGACGNVTRCVGDLICTEKKSTSCTIETEADLLTAEKINGLIRVNMGKAKLEARQIPLAKEMDTKQVDLDIYGLPTGICTNIGNPHITFFMDHLPDDAQMQKVGPLVEHHSLFPERVNVGFAKMVDDQTIRLRVWERGAGITEACGTAACAAAVAATRRQVNGRRYQIDLDGGKLDIDYQPDGAVMMTGPIAYVFEGKVAFDD